MSFNLSIKNLLTGQKFHVILVICKTYISISTSKQNTVPDI